MRVHEKITGAIIDYDWTYASYLYLFMQDMDPHDYMDKFTIYRLRKKYGRERIPFRKQIKDKQKQGQPIITLLAS